MTWWQTLLVVAVSGVIAPFFLWLQQRQQNQRDLAKEQIHASERAHEARLAEVAREAEGRRRAYVAALSAIGRFRAATADVMTAVLDEADRAGGVPGSGGRTGDLLSLPYPPIPVAKYGRVLEAIAEARLLVPRV